MSVVGDIRSGLVFCILLQRGKKSSVPRGLLASKVYSVQKYESLFKLLVSLMYARIAVSHVASTRLTLLIESNGSI